MDLKIKMEKNKFSHCSHKIILLATFSNRQQLYYVIQCENKEIFVGLPNPTFQVIAVKSLKDKIVTVAYSQACHCLYLGSSKGHLHIFNLSHENNHEDQKVETTDGKPLISIIPFSIEGESLGCAFTLTREGKIRKIEKGKVSKGIQLPFTISTMVGAKCPASSDDLHCAIFSPDTQTPYLFSLVNLLNFFDSPTLIKEKIEQYEQRSNFDEDQLMEEVPAMASINAESSILVTATSEKFIVHKIEKRRGLFYLVPECIFKQQILKMDLMGESLLFATPEEIVIYNLQGRHLCEKKLSLKGAMPYDFLCWANFNQLEFLYGFSKVNTMKLYFYSLKDK